MNTIITYLAKIIAVILVLCPHEFAHAYVAYKNGDGTAKFCGRMSLNPIRHLDPVGFVLCIFVGFGWAKPVPINPSNFKKRRIGIFTTAIAGVVVNYIISLIAYLAFVLVIKYLLAYCSVSTAADFAITFLYTTFYTIFMYGVYSFVFNLLPLYPLDGFRVFESFTREINPVRRFIKQYGQWILIVLLVWSYLCDIMIEYAGLSIFYYFDFFNYLSWFAVNIVAYPITICWDWILAL